MPQSIFKPLFRDVLARPGALPSPGALSLPPHRADERGFLVGLAAKLIGFAVLGVIVVGGAVYGIVKLTGNSGSEIIASHLCNEAEIFDLELYGARRAGIVQGFAGSAAGCIPVCVWHNDDDLWLEPDELRLHRELGDSVPISTTGVIAPNANYLFKTSNSTYGPAETEIALDSVSAAAPIYKVQVDADQNQCRLTDARGEPVPPGTAIELNPRVVAPAGVLPGSAPENPPAGPPGSPPASAPGRPANAPPEER